MDGLSAASGVFAVVSLAAELPTAIQGLVEFCRTIKDAPDDVRRLAGELDSLAVALKQSYRTGRASEHDAAANLAVYQCNMEMLSLRKVISSLVSDFNSPSSRKRSLGALKAAIKKPHIEAVRSSLEKIKSTLILLNANSFQSSTELHFQYQQQLLLEIMQIVRSQAQKSEMEDFETRVTAQNSKGKDSIGNSNQLKLSSSIADQAELDINIRIPSPCEQDLPLVNQKHRVSPSAPDSRAISVGSIDSTIVSWSLATDTPFGVIQEGVVQKKSLKGTTSDDSDVVRSWRVYPSALLKLLGVRHGAMIQASMSGWQWVVKPFNAAPESAPIFEFCRDGDLDGVKAVLKLGHGSLRDRDPKGRTPLWVAAQYLQLEVAEFLLLEGADIHASDWAQGSPRPPILAIQAGMDADANKKAAFISLFERYRPGAYENEIMWKLILRLIMFYRPLASNDSMHMTSEEKRNSALMLTKQVTGHYFFDDEEVYSRIVVHMLDFDIKRDPLRWALRNVKGKIIQQPSRTLPRAIHRVFTTRLPVTDLPSMKLIVEKSGDLHCRWFPDWSVSAIYTSFTPTTLALYDPTSFVAWRDLLEECGYNLTEFVEEELVDSPLVDDGWTLETLSSLFKMRISTNPDSGLEKGPFCGRCHTTSYFPSIHITWRQYLRAVRNGNLGPFDQKFSCTLNTIDKSSHSPSQYVCSNYCADKFCIAGVYENNLADTDVPYGPDVPAYMSKEERLMNTKPDEILITDCPTKQMPGAFVE